MSENVEIRGGRRGGAELNKSERGGGGNGPLQVVEGQDSVDYNAEMDT